MPDTQETPTQQARRLLDKYKDACIARGVADHRDFAPVGRVYHDEKIKVIGDAIIDLVERMAGQVRDV